MPLMPTDIRDVTFSKPSIGKRGYHEDEVDALLDLVQAELARLIQEHTALRDQLEQYDQQLRGAPVRTGDHLRPVQPLGRVMVPIGGPVGNQAPPDGDHNVPAVKVLGLAQGMAERLTSEAKSEADGMLTKAHVTGKRILSEATTQAQGLVTDARTRAETMLTDARSRAETRKRQSRDKVASLERDAARQRREVLAAITQERTLLEDTIEGLRTFDREYRTRLTTYLQSQLRQLDGPRSTVPADPTRTQRDLVTVGSTTHTEPTSASL